MKYFLFLFLMAITLPISAQTTDEPEWEMKQYYMVLLTKGPNRSQDSATAADLQIRHLQNIDSLYNIGKIEVAGPFGDDGNLRGIFIFDVETEKEVLDLLETDPAIRAGRLSYEVHPWWTAKGVCFD